MQKELRNIITTALVCFISTTSASIAQSDSKATNPCHSGEIKRTESQTCLMQGIVYGNNGSRELGTLITLSAAKQSNSNKYWLQTADNKLINLHSFEQNNPSSILSCAFKSLGYNPQYIGNQQSYSISHFGSYRLELKNGALEGVLKANYPFTGTLSTPDGTKCKGNFDYAHGIFSWKEAKSICEKTYTEDAGRSAKPQLRQMRHYYHTAGIYYLCEIEEANVRADENKTTSYYRIDFEKDGKPGVVLMREATYAQQSKWKFK